MLRFILISFFILNSFAVKAFILDVSSPQVKRKIEDYQLGSEWGNKKVTQESIQNESEVFNLTVSATAFLPIGGTGFYLGKIAGHHLLATNYHVCPHERVCIGDFAQFRILDKNFKITKLFISLPDVDLSLLAIEVPETEEALMQKVARRFSFKRDLYKGQNLLTAGFGKVGNSQNNLMANQDSDCKVFSDNAHYKYLVDPDEFKSATYKVWSFAHGCDISHGDSGSALVDRETGDVVGIIWTGKVPKAKLARSSKKLAEIFYTSSPAIWNELSYAVPSVKIGEDLTKYADSKDVEEEIRIVLRALLNN